MAKKKVANWMDMWQEDKVSIIKTMMNNLVADLEVGYSPRNGVMLRQISDIVSYMNDYGKRLYELRTISEDKAQRWCRNDMKKRGVIE